MAPSAGLGALLILAFASIASAATTHPAPVAYAPTQRWEGDGGQWNTFDIGVGTPYQYVRVLPSTINQNTLVVLPLGCQGASNQSTCATLRGGLFNPVNSSTYKEIGVYDVTSQVDLDIVSNADYGYDDIILGGQASTANLTVKNTAIGGIADLQYYTGFLGLKSGTTTLGSSSSQSILDQLKSSGAIPSLTFAYTAGALYRLRGVLASLTFGGYDQSRFMPNALSFTLASSATRPLVVGVPSIASTIGSGSNYAPGGFYANIDSTVPEIWLPNSVCDQIARDYNLTYDNTTELYFVNDTTRSSLLTSSPNITITLDIGLSSTANSVNITLPYASFDLTAVTPYRNLNVTSQRFFPIRRANTSNQYTLGRTFLQEAYLSVDWERSTFNVSQCVWIDGAPTSLVAILPIEGSSSGNSSGLSSGAIAGIVVGVVVGVLLIVAGALLLWWRRRKAQKEAAAQKAKEDDVNEFYTADAKVEGGNVYQKAELDAGAEATHPDAFTKQTEAVPVEAANTQKEIFEMPGDTPKPSEMASPAQMQMSEKEAAVERERLYNGIDPSVTPSMRAHNSVRTHRSPRSPRSPAMPGTPQTPSVPSLSTGSQSISTTSHSVSTASQL